MPPIRTLVVDDEPEARDGIMRLLRRDPELEIVGECANGREAVDAIDRLRPDVVLLDVQMPELDGFAVLERVPADRRPEVVFVTGHDEHALRAFEAHALDYLLKPYSDDRLARAVAHAKGRVQQRRIGELGRRLAALVDLRPAVPPLADVAPASPEPQPSEPPEAPRSAEPPEYLDRIVVRHARDVLLVRVEEIDWIGAADYYAELHVARRTYLVRETMQRLAARLDPRRFVRIHRSAIVNVDRVRLIQPHYRGGHVVVLRDGAKLVMSRGRREALERALGQRI